METDDSSVEMIHFETPTLENVKEEECVVTDSDVEEVENEDEGNYEKDNDPMDLLEQLQKPDTESESTNNSETEKNFNKLETHVMRLTQKYNWICKREDDLDYVYCLYCNVSLKTKTTLDYQKHSRSMTHIEREQDYLNFMSTPREGVRQIRSNKDFDGDIRRERELIEGPFSDYLWEIWCAEYEWMNRTNEPGYFTFCKYCKTKIFIANSRSRKMHAESQKHKDFKRNFPKRRVTVGADSPNFEGERSLSNQELEKPEDGKDISDPLKIVNNSFETYCEPSKSSSDLCRCKLCDITMFAASFNKHTSSNLHKQNLSALDDPNSEKLEKPNWAEFSKLHPWLIEDPTNPMEAYCRFCEKRIGYGKSTAKRLIHEHSAPHRAAAKKFDEKLKGEENEIDTVDSEKSLQTVDIESNGNDDETVVSDEMLEPDETTTESQTESVQSLEKTALEEKFPWAQIDEHDNSVYCRICERTFQKASIRKHDATKLHLSNSKKQKTANSEIPKKTANSWVIKFKNNPHVIFCRYCRVRISSDVSRHDHEITEKHIEAEKKFPIKKNNQGNKKVRFLTTGLKLKIKTPISMTHAQLKGMFEWLQFKKGLMKNYGYCIYCEKSIYIVSPKFGAKHQRSGTHIRARTQYEKQNQTNVETPTKRKAEIDENTSEVSSFEPLIKRHKQSLNTPDPAQKCYKNSSLYKAIQTAKDLTAAHVEMISFMRKYGRSPDVSTPMKIIEKCQQTSKPILTTSSHGHATPTRDPFDLFFNSISESLKILPPDLASEGKLKVMQIMFDLETRAQKRQNPTEENLTSNLTLNSTPNLKPKKQNGSILYTALLDIPGHAPAETEDKKEGTIESSLSESKTNRTPQKDHQNNQVQDNNSTSKIFHSASPTLNTNLHTYSNSNSDTTKTNLISQPQLNNNNSNMQRNPLLRAQLKSTNHFSPLSSNVRSPIQQAYSPNLQNSTKTTLTQHMNKNTSSSIDINAGAGFNRNYNNNGKITAPSRSPHIRTVPLVTTTGNRREDSPLQLIQLNSSTQSKIITIDETN